jgi:hypothetical protein
MVEVNVAHALLADSPPSDTPPTVVLLGTEMLAALAIAALVTVPAVLGLANVNGR